MIYYINYLIVSALIIFQQIAKYIFKLNKRLILFDFVNVIGYLLLKFYDNF